MSNLNLKVVCKDGFSMSVQANSFAYCTPRQDNATYTEVEVGFPSQREELLMGWAENPDRPTDTVYGYVPTSIVYLVITKHGGMLRGQAPKGVFVYDSGGIEHGREKSTS